MSTTNNNNNSGNETKQSGLQLALTAKQISMCLAMLGKTPAPLYHSLSCLVVTGRKSDCMKYTRSSVALLERRKKKKNDLEVAFCEL